MGSKPANNRTMLRKSKLQRIVRQPDRSERPDLSGGFGQTEPRANTQQYKAATLAPELLNQSSVSSADEVLYQCTECDMIVRASDPYCPFCGSVFADVPVEEGSSEDSAAEDAGHARPLTREEIVRPEKFDLFSLVETRNRYRELLYQEATKGFAGSARLLEEIEHLISAISSLGTDMTKARRLMGSAWEACRDGNWHLVTTLVRQTEDIVAPSIPDLVKSELSRAREYLMKAKASGHDISDYVIKIKSATHALKSGDPDEALRLTKELVDSLREDSISWG